MAQGRLQYGSGNQAITITLNALASSATAGRESTLVSNASNEFVDVFVQVIVNVGSGTIANDQCAYVWAYGTADAAGNDFSDAVTGTDAAYTPRSPTCLKPLGTIPIPTQSLTYKGGPWSIANAFGYVPEEWGIVVRNYSGIALGASSEAFYQGVYVEGV